MVLERIGLGDWAYCLAEARRRNNRVASGKEVMEDRLERGIDDPTHFERSTWLAGNSNIVDGKILLARGEFNPLIPYAVQAVEAQRTGEFYLTDEIVKGKRPFTQILRQIAETDAKKKIPTEKRRVLDIGKAVTHQVSTDSFADDPVIRWQAGSPELANRYGLFLRNKLPENLRLNEVTVYLPDKTEKDYARGHWLYRLGWCDESGFSCSVRFLYDGCGSVFGVPLKSAEGTSRLAKTG